MQQTLERMNKKFSPLQKTASPLVDKLHPHLDIFPYEESQCHHQLADNGFLNFNLCLNAQTDDVHTECDASYTVISVPKQIPAPKDMYKKNKGRFELNINDACTFVIPMEIGTSFVYSGYLLSHRQQIHYGSENCDPFVNIVSYNSKRLFENMLQSFRRYLGDHL